MKRKLISIFGICLMLQSCYMSATTPEVIAKEPIKIIDTIRIEPDVVTLLKAEVKYTRNWDENVSDTTISVTQEEAEELMKIAHSEAGNQGIQGQKKIMEVVWNRKNNPNYADSIYGVISESGQFDSFLDGQFNVAEPTVEAHLALAEFEKNLNNDNQIIAFETTSNGSALLKYYELAYIFGDHAFYIEKNH